MGVKLHCRLEEVNKIKKTLLGVLQKVALLFIFRGFLRSSLQSIGVPGYLELGLAGV
jgi:hypothetical protein